MDQNKIGEYKNKLEAERGNILARLTKDASTPDFGSDVDHGEEEENEAEEMVNRLALNQELKNRLENINEALKKISDGEYGNCENCGGEIEEKILSMSPESRLCQNCKKIIKQ